MKRISTVLILHLVCCITLLNAQSEESIAKVQLNTAQWGQDYPFNTQLPIVDGINVKAGCVPVACAIIMNWHKWPYKGVGQTDPYMTWSSGIEVPSRDLTEPYDWMLMKHKYKVDETADEPARLIADIGAAIGVDYSTVSSPAFTDLKEIVRRFGYGPEIKRHSRNEYTDSLWHHLVRAELDNGSPVLYTASSGESGHAFVVDGYDDKNHYHVNWGWDGDYNGWYSLDSLIAGFRYYDKSHTIYTGFVPHRELYEKISDVQQRRYMQDMAISYDKGTGCVSIKHPEYSVVQLQADGQDFSYCLSRWNRCSIFHTQDVPADSYVITILAGPYSHTIHLTIQKH